MSLVKIYITDKVVVVPITAGIPQILSPFLREYRHYCPHYRGNYQGYCTIITIPIPMSLFNCDLFSCL